MGRRAHVERSHGLNRLLKLCNHRFHRAAPFRDISELTTAEANIVRSIDKDLCGDQFSKLGPVEGKQTLDYQKSTRSETLAAETACMGCKVINGTLEMPADEQPQLPAG